MPTKKEGLQLWKKFTNVPCTDEDLIDEPFVTPYKTFKKGTNRFDIWHWFEDTFDDFSCAEAMNHRYG